MRPATLASLATAQECKPFAMNDSTSPFVWLGLMDHDGACAPAARAWCDAALASQAGTAGSDPPPSLYSAFNRHSLALVAQSAAPVAVDAAELPALPPGAALRQEVGELSYERRQSGVSVTGREPILYSVRFKVPDDWTEEFDRWYEEEHVPMIYDCQHWAMTRRYRLKRAGAHEASHLALHYLFDARGLDAPQLVAARKTPWRQKFLQQRWFTDVEKIIYLRLDSASEPA